MNEREIKIRRWFGMWLDGKCNGIEELFCIDAVYTESWGPKYEGLPRIRHWFEEWNTRGKVCVWEIRQFFHKGDQTVVEWYFANVMNDGREEKFDGMSLTKWRGAVYDCCVNGKKLKNCGACGSLPCDKFTKDPTISDEQNAANLEKMVARLKGNK